jgi:molybdate transport system substrate-binding protein
MRASTGLRILIVLAALPAAMPAIATADELTLLSAAALRPALLLAPAQFERASGHRVTLGFGNATAIQNKVTAGERVDVVVLPPKQIDELAGRGLIANGSRSDLGVVRLGIAARTGSALPHIGTVEEFKRALLAASSFGMPDPADGSTSSLYVAELLRRLNLTDAMQGRIRLFADGTKALEEIAQGNLTLTVAPITSIRTVKGVELVDSLPESLQLKTLYAAAIPVATPFRQSASALLNWLKAPEFAVIMRDKGIDPP